MKTKKFCAELSAKGCFLFRHGKRHDMWKNPANGNTFAIPRHDSQEIPKALEIRARKALGI